MKIITTRKGEEVLVDDQDYERLSAFTWWVDKRGYVVTKESRTRKVLKMHRFVLGVTDPDVHVDHEHGNKLDNRRTELRAANKHQNTRNRGRNKNNSTGFKGVTPMKRLGKFQAQIVVNSKHLYLGVFDDPFEAALAYDKAAVEVHGEFARTNKMLGLLEGRKAA